ncbi:beta-1,3-galactosyltransferase 5-like [Plakobranchus ocellatus]|uniref:Hexosyltransferase n=1 Tax=Plakobranchus ocellatus TaxID=259542 RepID=A0AAV3ZHD6_9GAST|nr:beta-1,3-galactosyltransferase 5-like [Plakobranchus ocellatus]
MEWMEGGIIRIPLKYVYLCAIVLFSAYFVAREISMTNKWRRQTACQGFRQNLQLRQTSEQLASRDFSVPGSEESGPESADETKKKMRRDGTNAGRKSKDEICRRRPTQTNPLYCPDCIRPRAIKLSERMQHVSYSSLMFPRGPSDLFQLRETKQQNFVEDYLIKPWAVCSYSRRCPYLLAVQLLFVLGHQVKSAKPRMSPASGPGPQKNLGKKRLWDELQAEADAHGDLLFIDMHDSYFNLTLKLMSAFKWVYDHCPTTKFVLKIDTDTFVNIPLLIDVLILNKNRLRYSVIGTIYTQERAVHRSSKWAVNTSVYPPPVFPVYASGCNYVISTTALGQLMDIFPFMPLDHTTTFLGADFFATGAMGQLLSFDFFDIPEPAVFGPCNRALGNPCEMILDNRIFGVVPHSPGNMTYLLKLWRSFYRYYGHSR